MEQIVRYKIEKNQTAKIANDFEVPEPILFSPALLFYQGVNI
ncbi:hypothetical protein [Thermophagus sp. OGC60D27]